MPHRLAGAADVHDPERLFPILGDVRSLSRVPMKTVGFSGARHDRVAVTLANGETRRLVVKQLRVAEDWVAVRSGDSWGREAELLAEPALAAVWDVIQSPYLAFWSDGGEIGLVMDDLSPFLLPDVRAPVSEEQEEQLLHALARMHAQFWSSPVLDLPWLARPRDHVGILELCRAGSDEAVADLPAGFGTQVKAGWAAARRHLPENITSRLAVPAEEAAREWTDLPRTLLHGDVKVANFALMPDGKVAAFDWAMVGAGPVAVDVGWYLAVNASRLARSKDEFLVRYRTILQEELGEAIPDALWTSLARAAVVTGARMLLWSKALAREADGPGARAEWAWWVDHLADAST